MRHRRRSRYTVQHPWKARLYPVAQASLKDDASLLVLSDPTREADREGCAVNGRLFEMRNGYFIFVCNTEYESVVVIVESSPEDLLSKSSVILPALVAVIPAPDHNVTVLEELFVAT